MEIVNRITNRHIILIFDQWEKSRDAQLEGNIIDSFLRHIEDWPPSHIFLSLRPEGTPHTLVKEFPSAYPAAVEVYDLPPMHLDGNLGSALLRFIRDRTPAAMDISDDTSLSVAELETLRRSVAPMLAMGRLSALNRFAENNEYLARRNALLDELRDIARTLPEEDATLEDLAEGLFNTLNRAAQEKNIPQRLNAMRY